MTEHSTNAEPAFTRRKFTITETLDSELNSLAERHYQSNVSLCIRAAIEDHIQTLEGDGDATTRRLIAEIDEVGDTQQVLVRKISALESALETEGQQTDETSQSPRTGALPPTRRQVLDRIAAAESGLHVDDIMETLDLPNEHILAALGSLVDRGYVFRVEPNSERYRVPGTGQSPDGEFP